MATKAAKELAYKAGHSLPNIQWGDDATDAQKTPGVHHCPFDPRDPEQQEEREQWLLGLKDALGTPTQNPQDILDEIDAELGS